MKIGLFFGSFNPIHIGHLIIANTMVETTDLSKVWFVVSPQNPHKKSAGLLHEFDRLEMVEIAVADNFNLMASNVEFSMPRPSYTIDTLTYLQEKHPQHEFVLIIGEDNLVSFPRWKNWEQILEHFQLYVYPRPGSAHSELKEHERVKVVEAPLMDISATFIRRSIKENRSIRYLVHPDVEDHILSRKFYSF
jgi:nicotinate-nucleotide adenylyltransferase